MHIIQHNDIIDGNNINLNDPVAIQGGTFYSKINYNKKSIYIQLPECKFKQGIVTTQKGKYCDLLYERDNNADFIEWIDNFEQMILAKMKEKKDLWFQNGLSDDDLDEMITPINRSYKSGKYIYIRTYLSIDKTDKTIKCMIYDEQQNKLTEKSIDEECEIVPLIQIDGIKLSSRVFELNITLNQFMILDKKIDINNTCLIKNTNKVTITSNLDKDVNKKEEHKKEDSQEEVNLEKGDKENNLDKQDNLDNLDNLEEQVIRETDNLEEQVIRETEDNLDNLEEQAIKETEDNLEKNIEPGVDNNLLLKDNNIRDDNLEEVELVIEEDDDDEIRLKSANDVYYEIYRKARKKARELRYKAVEAYLEANAIKNKFLLEDLDSSSDDDINEDLNEEEYEDINE